MNTSHDSAAQLEHSPFRQGFRRRSLSGVDTAHRGQVLIMFAIFLVGLLGAVGLSVDLGVAFSQRRTMQAAADAGAYAGARAVLRNDVASVQGEVVAVVDKNKMNHGTITSVDCQYINDGGGELGSCAGGIPGGATGVRVTVTENHPTFFMQVVPGAPNNVTTSAVAAANIKLLPSPGGGPFLPCARQAITEAGDMMDIVFLDSDFNLIGVNPAAVGVKFSIFGPNDNNVQDCGIGPDKYNGAANQDFACTTAPMWCEFHQGNITGPVNQAVDGIDGCQSGANTPYNCVAFLPIATEKDQPLDASENRVWVVGFLPFYIEQGAQPNKYFGTLLDDYVVMGIGQEGSGGWTPGTQGAITIRLVE
jgi:Flp pilus assembly protein TadG